MASSSFTTSLQALFLTSSACAGYIFYRITVPLGLGKLLVSDAKAMKLPSRDQYIGLKPVDKLLTSLNYFFWPVMNNNNSKLSLQSYRFGGQLAAIWMLILLESSRSTNRGTLMSYTTVLGLFMQVATYAVTMPLWLTFYLSSASTSAQILGNLPSPLDANSIPISVILGFTIPAILSALPLSETRTARTKLGFMAFWQVFPLWAGLLHRCLRSILPMFGFSRYVSAASKQDTTRAIRRFYTFALVIASLTHCTNLDRRSLGNTFTDLFSLLPAKLPPFARIHKFKTLEEGVAEFLAWDETIGSLSIAIWALRDLGIVLVNQEIQRQIQVIGGLFALLLFAGPAGLIIGARWTRDELIGL